MSEAPRIGRRVVIWGVTGSGKTTFSRRLGALLGLGVIELDAIAHADGWDSATDEEFVAKLRAAMASHAQGWVVDGSYSRISHVYLEEADTLIWLHLPWRVSFWRLLNRTVRRSLSGEEVYPGSPARESLQKAFLSRDSILWWGINHHRSSQRSRRRRSEELRARLSVIELRSSREVEALLQQAASMAPR